VKTKQKSKRLVPLRKRVVRHAKMVFVPHKANQYRPHLIRRYGIIAVLIAVIGLQAGYNLTTTGSVLGVQASVTDTQLLTDTNSERTSNNLSALTLNTKLSQAAYLKADDMFSKQYWAHNAPDGTTPWHWFDQVGYNYEYAGENLAKNFTSSSATLTAWMASPEHRANILNNHYTDVGFAVVTGELQGQETLLVVAEYGSQATQGSVAGVQTKSVNAAPPQSINFVTRLGVAIQSLSPAALGSAILIILVGVVALVANLYRNKLPKAFRQGWAKHHGLAKAAGMASLLIVIVAIYSGGQI
jgi:hypothetical protein